MLLAAGADVKLQDKSGQTPLNLLLQKNQPLRLIAAGSNPGLSNQTKLAELLREHGALEDVPRPNAIQVRRPTGFSDIALIKGTNDWNRFTILEILAMESGLLTKVPQGESQQRFDQSVWSRSPAAYPDLEKVKLMVAHKADVNAKDKDGATPLRWAIDHGKKDIADLLRQHGAKE